MGAQQLLDQVQSMARVVALEAEPHGYAELLADELARGETGGADDPDSPDALAARDERLRDALARIDALAERAMRIRMDYLLVDDPAIATMTRKVFASTVLRYAEALDVLAARAREAASRGGSRDPDRAGEHVVDAATAALALRDAIRGGVLALIAARATASLAIADRTARDRRLEDATRRIWSARRRELEATAAQPARIVDAAFAARVASWPEQIDEPDPAKEPTFADMIELD